MKYKTVKKNYKFECTLCANCCTGDTQILLDFFDLYKMSKFLNFSNSGDLFKRNFVFLTKAENDFWRPQIRFKTKPFKFCPFLNNHIDEEKKLTGFCQLHSKYKPLVCSMAPIGKRYDFNEEKEEYIFHAPAPDCTGIHRDKLNTISELEKKYKLELTNQTITFHILDKIRIKKMFNEYEMKELYSFPVNQDFNEIILKIMDILKIYPAII